MNFSLKIDFNLLGGLLGLCFLFSQNSYGVQNCEILNSRGVDQDRPTNRPDFSLQPPSSLNQRASKVTPFNQRYFRRVRTMKVYNELKRINKRSQAALRLERYETRIKVKCTKGGIGYIDRTALPQSVWSLHGSEMMKVAGNKLPVDGVTPDPVTIADLFNGKSNDANQMFNKDFASEYIYQFGDDLKIYAISNDLFAAEASQQKGFSLGEIKSCQWAAQPQSGVPFLEGRKSFKYCSGKFACDSIPSSAKRLPNSERLITQPLKCKVPAKQVCPQSPKACLAKRVRRLQYTQEGVIRSLTPKGTQIQLLRKNTGTKGQ